MSYEQYWEQSPQLAIAYRDAYKIKREIDNEQAWIQGLYIYDAFAVALANAFSKRGSTKQSYLEKPIDLFPPDEFEKKRREKEEYAKMQKALEAMQRKRRRMTKGD